MRFAAIHMEMPPNGVKIAGMQGDISFAGIMGSYPHDRVVPLDEQVKWRQFWRAQKKLPKELTTMELRQGAAFELIAFNGVVLPIVFGDTGSLTIGEIVVPRSGHATGENDRLRAHGIVSVFLLDREQ